MFAQRMMFPEGCLWHGGSLYVAAPPEIWKLTDADGDGVAEKREVWFDGKTLTGWHKNPGRIGHGTGGVWKVEAETADGTDVELKMDPNDGHIMGSEADKVEH